MASLSPRTSGWGVVKLSGFTFQIYYPTAKACNAKIAHATKTKEEEEESRLRKEL